MQAKVNNNNNNNNNNKNKVYNVKAEMEIIKLKAIVKGNCKW